MVVNDLWHTVLKSHKSKMGIICVQSWKQCALLVIVTMALWQLRHMKYSYTLLVPMNQRVHNKLSKEDNIRVHRLLLQDLSTLCFADLLFEDLYYSLYLVCCALFVSLLPAMCNRISCAQGHELPQSHCDDNKEGALFPWLHIYIIPILLFEIFEHYLCCGSLMST